MAARREVHVPGHLVHLCVRSLKGLRVYSVLLIVQHKIYQVPLEHIPRSERSPSTDKSSRSICRYGMLCRTCIVQTQPTKHVLDHVGRTAPTRQHELDHTDHPDQESTDLSVINHLDHEVGIDVVSEA